MITVVVPTIPGRQGMLARAINSVHAQLLPPETIIVEPDLQREGAAVTRQRALMKVKTPWVAFLDDDDEYKPEHLAALYTCAIDTAADYVYPWFEVVGGIDPMPGHFGLPWDVNDPRETTITVLARTELAQKVGFTAGAASDPDGRPIGGEDYRFVVGCNALGARIVHLPQRTWLWHHHGGNTSGIA